MSPSLHDLEAPAEEIGLEQVSPPTITQYGGEHIEFDNTPPIQKSWAESWLWTQSQCSRGVELSTWELDTFITIKNAVRRAAGPEDLLSDPSQLETLRTSLKRYLESLNDLTSIQTRMVDALTEAKWWKRPSHNRMRFITPRQMSLKSLSLLSTPIADFLLFFDSLLNNLALIRQSEAIGNVLPFMEGIFQYDKAAMRQDLQVEATKLSGMLHMFDPTAQHEKTYLVIGWFPRGSTHPHERMLVWTKDEDLIIFQNLRATIRRIRGWREYLSLKSVSGFGIYKCDPARGMHTQQQLSQRNQNTIASLFLAYRASQHYHHADTAQAWTTWIKKNFNSSSESALEGRYSLELKYAWSAIRLTIAVTLPVVLSFSIGLGYMIKTGDVSTAWTISSYIVSAAGAIIALLAILSGIN
ncbi:hypothetical protein BJX65DRAFT_315417 [Aspergillus insuetus]